MSNPGNSVWLSILRSAVIAICGVLASKGIISAESAPEVQTAIMTLLPIVIAAGTAWWGAHTHTDASKVASAAALPDVAQIVVKPYATDGVAAAAADPAQPKVVKQGTNT